MQTNFVMLDSLNKAYEDLGWIDYFTINKITDDSIYLTIFTKIEVSMEDTKFDTLVLRNIDLGEAMHKEIVWDYKSSSTNFFINFVRSAIRKRKENKIRNL